VVGKSPLAFGRNIFGIAQAAEQVVTKVYSNGGKRSGVLSLDRQLTPAQREQIRANFSTLTTGTDERLLVLEMGMKFDAISMSPQDIELLASRRYQLEEICRWFGVPSVLVNDTSGSTTWGSGIEQLVSGFYKLNLRPYLERFEASVSANLLTESEAAQYEFEFDFEGLLRSDLKSRLEGYRTAVSGSILTPNEVRRIEGWSPMTGGDSLLSQVNMTPIENLGESDSSSDYSGDEMASNEPDIQQLSLNGAQVSSLLEVITAIATGQMPIETGRAIIDSAFPVISDAQLNQIISPLNGFEAQNTQEVQNAPQA
jgi:hypothetical protein